MDFPKGIYPPENGWLEKTWYLCEVSYRYGNPIHNTLFYTGFLDNNEPAGYNCLVPTNGAESGGLNINDVRYLKAIKVVLNEEEC